jgi:hypothetical protein
MSDQLATYLNDHLAGARFAIDLLTHMRDAPSDDNLKEFAAEMLAEIEEDRRILQRLSDRVSEGRNVLKEATAWLAEKASRLKLRVGADDHLAIFEALEALSLGVLGKIKLWQALSTLADTDVRLSDHDFATLARRAQSQHDKIEARRLATARVALSGDE